MRARRAVQRALCRELRRAGANVDLERVIPELSGRRQAGRQEATAVMDLCVNFPGTAERLLIDVTIRAPHAARYKEAHRAVGTAAAAGAKEKLELYGETVLPLPFETYGRLGNAGVDTLAKLALAANTRGAWTHQPRLLMAWRSACERALHYATADVAILALGGAEAMTALRGL